MYIVHSVSPHLHKKDKLEQNIETTFYAEREREKEREY